jgi:hypothetical protein
VWLEVHYPEVPPADRARLVEALCAAEDRPDWGTDWSPWLAVRVMGTWIDLPDT